MKVLIVILLIFFSVNVLCQENLTSKILIKYIHPGVHTIVAVDYKEFDTAFAKSMYKDTLLDNLLFLQKIKKEYIKVKYRKSYKRIDIRYKISLYFPDNKKPILVYMSYYGEGSINEKLLANCEFLKSLNSLIDSLNRKR